MKILQTHSSVLSRLQGALVIMSDGTISGPAKSKVLSQPDKQDLRCCEEIGCIKFLLLY